MIIKNPRLTDHELLAKVRAQSREDAEALYDRYAKALLLAILRRVPN
ncbi:MULTISPECIES: hypothetical protein [unclassified Mucilaginibacter]|nr:MULTISPECIES: hypothetical protein [unclassified Mucilaginibacter]MEB0260052.1 hypothetical protein [Mucilaginibacter sp. 10I4]MEB0280557.1 hypothetical protein [Mucilaginibacter sp. 10B2]MEB0301103.1 hypothetical protein [Mucilaginibacter sp. 5C4]WPX22411.1 hypothetical protein RHM67_14070 [Mucilaginibacter sp. 5C4]